MPSTRARLGPFDAALDRIVVDPFRANPPDVLFHYTRREVAPKILSSGELWATRHDHTNDTAELASADSIVLGIARNWRMQHRHRRHHGTLDFLIEFYGRYRAASFVQTFLACLSSARDAIPLWGYGGEGRGVCLGFRVLHGEAITLSDMQAALARVEYDLALTERRLIGAFHEVFAELDDTFPARVPLDAEACVRTALCRLAAFANATTKYQQWANECEWRYLVFPKQRDFSPPEYTGANGPVPYVALPIRAAGRRVVLDEVILGPNNIEDCDAVRGEFAEALGVTPDSFQVVRSSHAEGDYIAPRREP